ncbi:MAG: hypothetical protein JST92_05110, partial [Deltaproteobacteria bacterium]|nr:hypothetical protein [Deltaproteobacteria bacterium]
ALTFARGTCTLEVVSEHRATCVGAALRVGDTAELARKESEERPALMRAPAQSAASLEQARVELDAAGQPLLASATPAPDAALPHLGRVQVGLVHTSILSTDGGPWHREAVEARIHGAPVFAGFALDADLEAVRWTRRPDGALDEPGVQNQLHVWQLSLSSRSAERGFSAALGRLAPWAAPGATRLDGAQAGLVRANGDELGVYGGALPDTNTLEPRTDQATGGLYWSLRRDELGPIAFLQHTGRVAFVTVPGLGQRVEAEGALLTSITRAWQVGLELRAGAGGTLGSGLEAARIDVSGRIADALTLSLGGRWQGVDRPEFAQVGLTQGGREAGGDALLRWDGAVVSIGLTGGGVTDLDTQLSRGFAGPELSLPHLWSERLVVSLGAREEFGWLRGRSAWVQAIARPASSWELLARGTWSMQTRADTGFDYEVGAALALVAHLTEHLDLRLDTHTRMNPAVGSQPSLGSVIDAALAGRF